MNSHFLVSVVAVIVMMGVFGYVVHGMMLIGDYNRLKGYRSKESAGRYYPFMLPAHIIAAIAFVWLYTRTMSGGSPLEDGIRFGLAVAALMVVHKFVIFYAIQEIPGSLTIRQVLFDTIGVLIMSIVVAFINSAS